MLMNFRDLTGQKFGRLTAIRRVENLPPYGQARWLFKCECGSDIVIFGYSAAHGKQKSCGCYERDNPPRLKHGGTGTPEFRSWTGMRARCMNKNNAAYHLYGGRGIKICERWGKFDNFLADMGPRPSKSHSLDRVNPNGDYEPSNCRWASHSQQVRNRRLTVTYTHNGETLSLPEWAERFCIPYPTVWTRHKNGWTGDKLFSPLGPTSGKK